MGRAGRVPGTRELVIPDTPYILPYRVRAGAVDEFSYIHCFGKFSLKKRRALPPITALMSAVLNPS